MKKDKCLNHKSNLERCNCTYSGCSKKGICCECIAYHRQSQELPACFFSAEVEKSYDRSIRNFINTHKR